MTKTLNTEFGCGGDIPVTIRQPGAMTPKIDKNFVFKEKLVRLAAAWILTDASQNLLLNGPTGAGKSSLIENFCARLGIEVYRVACHGRMEFQDLLGSWRLVESADGKPVQAWHDGPLPLAARSGAVLLLDEINFLHPSVVGGLNSVMDGAPIFIPETGERIVPHEDFRVAATGNAVNFDDDASRYKGIQRQNIAMLDRLMVGEVDYLEALDESRVVYAAAPKLPSWIIQMFIAAANEVRSQFKSGQMETTISTRGLIRWAKLTLLNGKSLNEALQSGSMEKGIGVICDTLDHAVALRASGAERQTMHGLVQRLYNPQ